VADTPIETGDQNAWTKLRRRKVVQWGVAYAAGAWLLMQVLEYFSGTFDWPRQVQQLSTLALLIGLPISLVLAWYHGDRGGGVFWYFQRPSETPTVAPPGPTNAAAFATDASIAVLPFVNMSPDREQEYFADGISEELLNLLAQVPELRVIARTSSFLFKGKNVEIAEIARRLNVTNVLEGSVRRSGDKLRITAQLVRASDSSHLWSQKYDRQITDVFQVQDEIAAAVVSELKIILVGSAPTARVTDPKAYALFLQARELRRKFSAPAFKEAMALYKQVLAIDPAYAPAWDGLAAAYFGQIDYFGVFTADQGAGPVREAIQQALAQDPYYAPTYARAALVAGLIDRDLAAAALHLEKGLALDPGNYEVLSEAVTITRRLGRPDQSIALAEYLVSRDPLNPDGHGQLGHAYLGAGRLDEALAEFRNVLSLTPAAGVAHERIGEVLLLQGYTRAALAEVQQEPEEHWRLVGLALAHYALGNKAESDTALDALIRQHERTMSVQIADVLAFRGEVDCAFEWLGRAIKYRDTGAGGIPFSPRLKGLHADPRWLPFLRRHGMAPEQLAAIKFDVKVPK
jgi:TolB-like protein